MIYSVMKDLLNRSAQLNQLEISAVANMLTLALGQNLVSCLPRQNFMAASEIPYVGPVLKENLCIMLLCQSQNASSSEDCLNVLDLKQRC